MLKKKVLHVPVLTVVIIIASFGLACATKAYLAQSAASSNIPSSVSSGVHKKAVTPTSGASNVRLLFMGDTMLARTVGSLITDGKTPYEHVENTLQYYDLRLANVETTIADPALSHQAIGKLYTFNAPVRSFQTLEQAKIDVAMLANNHSRDYGPLATANMIDNLHKAGVRVAGAGQNVDEAFKPLIVDVPTTLHTPSITMRPKVRIAIIAVNAIENSYTNATASEAGSAYFDKTRIASAITSARQTARAEVIIVVPHWGVEYQSQPSDDQVSWGHYFIDSGADMVIGSHPHVVQPTEVYNGKSIVYSMGNFIFDGMSGAALHGQMIGVTIKRTFVSGDKKLTLNPPDAIPIDINESGEPVIH